MADIATDGVEQAIEVSENKKVPYVVLDAPLGGQVYLIGTAHFSHESQKEVTELIRQIQPNRVVLELCNSRVNILKYDEETLMKEYKQLDNNRMIQLMKEVSILPICSYSSPRLTCIFRTFILLQLSNV
jgi:pheromone shutdown protein TraB